MRDVFSSGETESGVGRLGCASWGGSGSSSSRGVNPMQDGPNTSEGFLGAEGLPSPRLVQIIPASCPLLIPESSGCRSGGQLFMQVRWEGGGTINS
jgi:hypothetical protein